MSQPLRTPKKKQGIGWWIAIAAGCWKTFFFERCWQQIFLSHSARVGRLIVFLCLLLLLAIHYDSQNPNCLPILEGFNLHHPGKFGRDDISSLESCSMQKRYKRMIFVDICILIFHLQASVPFSTGSAPQPPARVVRLVWPGLFRVVHQDLHHLSCGSISQWQPQSNDQPCPPKSCMIYGCFQK